LKKKKRIKKKMMVKNQLKLEIGKALRIKENINQDILELKKCKKKIDEKLEKK